MTRPHFDELIHAPVRLRLCATLAGFEQVRFATVRDALEVSDSVLSKHVTALAQAGYVQVVKRTDDGRVHTWLALTREGRRAWAGHVAALQQIVGGTSP